MKQTIINQDTTSDKHLLKALSMVKKQSMLKTLHFIKSNLQFDLPKDVQKELETWQIDKITREMPDSLRRRTQELIFEFYKYPPYMKAAPAEHNALEAIDLTNFDYSRYYRMCYEAHRNGELNLSVAAGKYANILYPINQEYQFGYFITNPCGFITEKQNFLCPLNRQILLKVTADVELSNNNINSISKLIPGNDNDPFFGLTGVTGDFSVACTYVTGGQRQTKTSSFNFLSRFQAADRAEAAFYTPRFKAVLETYLPTGLISFELTLQTMLKAYTSQKHDLENLGNAEQLAFVDLREKTDHEHPLYSELGSDFRPPGGVKINNIHFQFFEGNIINNDNDIH